MKTCTKCKQNQPKSQFNKESTAKDGLNTKCKTCSQQIRQQWREDNRERKQQWAKDNPYKAATKRINILQQQKQWREDNKEHERLQTKNWNKANPDKVAAYKARYRAAKLKATPKWLTAKDHKDILAFYTRAQEMTRETGIQYHVDHIIPLQGKNGINGLHVAWNLQILIGAENLSKSNSFPDDFHLYSV